MKQRHGGRVRPITPVDAIAEQLKLTPIGAIALRPGLPSPKPVYAGDDLPAAPDALSAADVLQAELDTVNAEINVLRRRDETLKFYMARLDEELRLAAKLQQDFLPKAL